MSLDSILKQLRRISDVEQIDIDDKSLYQIARSAGGSMRDAQRNLDQLVAFFRERRFPWRMCRWFWGPLRGRFT